MPLAFDFDDYFMANETDNMYSPLPSLSPSVSAELPMFDGPFPLDTFGMGNIELASDTIPMFGTDPAVFSSSLLLEGMDSTLGDQCVGSQSFDSFSHFSNHLFDASIQPFHSFQPYQQLYQYNTPSPSPLMPVDSPFGSFKSSTSPPHTPCIPMSMLAPTPATVPIDNDASSVSSADEQEDSYARHVLTKPLKRLVKKNIAVKPVYTRDFKKSVSPMASAPILSHESPEPSPVFDDPSQPLVPKRVVAAPTLPRRTNSSSKKSSASAVAAASASPLPVKKRHILQEWETEILNKCFEQNQFLQSVQASELSAQLGMTVNQVRIWFQNKRAYVKRQLAKGEEEDL
ncbi:hypothetical protein HK100_000521 [Physocladia obscura]|uniref:Homeobox domain-containing protein n=1 Tax=Physocladia obscura TaxID=109957 RepID=A0AAD5XFJ4_9FUNG|nr:hypothetical protein HK100_000521 [Physocladia obscura]